VKEEEDWDSGAGFHARWKEERSEVQLLAASGRSLFFEAVVRPGVLHHGGRVLRLLGN